ncbi:peptidoglycan DD-metalloendopeptidase family protein [Alcaligenes sp. SDU_A2]|uniref:peptidoglycan DD-metalloendopeptidase family protein n=1 Tax=Alcaligenes sp. SDU_A2 TaxID=3136634 RepID=UPI002C757884|nr:peptidoglycan DD-metalloendopeptidase family protein [Alcaligenes sp.]HRL27692.1 peptidoglycan DD-metalloendopeptidase family protein [Alcaligenes sp.]
MKPRHFLVVAVVASTLLAGCGSRSARAPVTDMSSSSASSGAASTASGTYVVRPGDTLYKIAQAHGMDVGNLISLNQITDPSMLRVGQVLRLDGKTAMPAGGGVASTQTSPVSPATPIKTETPSSAPRASDAALIAWGWPATGKIIQGFNSSTKGIDIEGKVGDPVVAAADGKIMYAGNGVRGLGSMVLVGHSNGFITAYAHNSTLHVKTGQQVKKGQRIADLGQSDTTSPRLHFEIRRSGTPVNPMSYLPAR